MKKLFFGLVATVLFTNLSFGQDENLLDYTNAFLKNDVEIINLLFKNKDLNLDDSFVKDLQDCKSEEEVIILFSKNNILNSSELILQIKIGIELTNGFKNNNPDFYKNDEKTRTELLNESFDISFDNTNVIIVTDPPLSTMSCYGEWQVDARRCNRNFFIAGAGAVAAAGLTGGIGGLIGGSIAMANFWFCRSDALDDYNTCING
jgi:hypothetical protein